MYDVSLPSAKTVVGRKFLGDLWSVKYLVIPEGVKVVGATWFYGTSVEIVVVPESALELEQEVFCCCKQLGLVVFATAGRLRRIGGRCFRDSGMEEVRLPPSLRELGD